MHLGQTVVFENVNVIPMDRERVIENQTVIVRDGRIAQIGPAAGDNAPAGATRVDGTGKYLMPGLAEMHGHLTANYLPDAAKADILYLYVANGVTTVRAMLGNPEAITTRDAIAAGKLLGPKLYVAGRRSTEKSRRRRKTARESCASRNRQGTTC